MSYCEQCKGPHQPKRKIPASRLTLAWYAARYIYERGAPGFQEAVRQLIPELTGITDEDLLLYLGDSTQCLRDLLGAFDQPECGHLGVSATEFLVLRDTGLTDAARVVTAVSDDPLCNVIIGFSTEEGGMTAVNWLVSDADAHALADGLRERLGEPDVDIAADHHSTERIAEAFQENAIHTHRKSSREHPHRTSTRLLLAAHGRRHPVQGPQTRRVRQRLRRSR